MTDLTAVELGAIPDTGKAQLPGSLDSQIREANTHNATLRCVSEITVAMQKQQVLHISACACACAGVCVCFRACRLAYPACVILSSAASLAPPYFLTLSHKLHDFRKRKETLWNIKCVF